MKAYSFITRDRFYGWISTEYELGVYLDFSKAFEKLIELNDPVKESTTFYEDGYGIDYWPDDDEELNQAADNDEDDLIDSLLEKHRITDIREICKRLCFSLNGPNDLENLSCEFYGLMESEIIE